MTTLTTILTLIYVLSAYGFSLHVLDFSKEEKLEVSGIMNALVILVSIFWPALITVVSIHRIFKKDK